MSSIHYLSIPQLAIQLRSKLTDDQFKELIDELVKNNIAEFQEYRRDDISKGHYSVASRTCPRCAFAL